MSADRAKERYQNEEEDDDEEYELNSEQIIQTILILGNEIWKNFGQVTPLDDVRIFFQHTFYIQCFQMAYPDFDFSSLLEDEDESIEPEKMAEAIQALIDLLGQEILNYDMSHIKGDEIINGNPEHCINLLQILQQISSASMMQDDDDEEGSPGETGQKSSSKKKESGMKGEQILDGMSPGSEEMKELKEHLGGKNDQIQKEYSEMFGLGEEEGEEGDEFGNNEKQQFLDNLEDEDNMEDGHDRVGEVIGNISKELDIEFDNEIQGNLQNLQGRGSDGSDEEGSMRQNEEEYGDQQEELEDEIIDHNDVNIIDGDDDYEEDQTPGAQFQEQMMNDMDDEEMDPDEYEQLMNEKHEKSENYRQLNEMDEDDDENQMMMEQHQKMAEMGQLGDGEEEEDEDEGQHYPDDGDNDIDEDIEQLEELEAQMQQQQMLNMPNEHNEFDDIDPELLEAAQKLGLDNEGIRALQQQMQQHQAEEEEELEQEDLEGHELAQMLNGMQNSGDHSEEQQILRGSQEIIEDEMDDQHEEMEGLGEEDLEDAGEDNDDQLIDIENLNDEDKVVLIKYLHEQYNHNPDDLQMPREFVEQFLAAHQDTIAKLQLDEDEGEDDDENSEIIHGQQNINDGNMVIQGEHNISDNAQQEIRGGEEQIEGEDEPEEYSESQQLEDIQNIEIQNQGQPPEGEPVEDGYDEEEDQPQIYNPQYQLEEIHEVDNEGNLIQQNLNVNTQAQMNEQQLQMMLMQQQMQYQQMNQMSQVAKRVPKKKKAMPSLRKPPLSSHLANNNMPLRNIAQAASKKMKRPKVAGINTISHDEENRHPNSRYGVTDGFGMQRKTHSQKRPQTAKTRKSQGAGSRGSAKRYNNYMAPGFGQPISSTPSHRLRGSVKGGLGSMMANTHGMMMPQQSQMFTSFGVPHNRSGVQNSTSHRKAAAAKKKYNQVATSSTMGKKKLRNSVPNMPGRPRTGKKNQHSLVQQQFPMHMQAPQGIPQELEQGASVSGQQNLVEMPILSEEFLNQLNEEQLQALLEQQQQLMQLQQQQNQQIDGDQNQEEEVEVNEEAPPGEQNPEGDESENNVAAQQMSESQQQELIDLQQQALLMQQYQQQQQMPIMENNFISQHSGAGNLRTRGRGKATTSGRGMASAGRNPAIAVGPKTAGSGSRSRHGSKKRSQKTRSSLNVMGSLPLHSASTGLGQGPHSLAVLPTSLSKNKKAAAQIYGSAGIVQSLTSQRKKNPSQQKKSGKNKRAQPMQNGMKNIKYNMQAQLQAQQAQYNMMNQEQMQQLMLQQQYQMQMAEDQMYQNQQMQAMADGQTPQYRGSEQQQKGDEGIIDEASPEQEDGESHSQFQNQMQGKDGITPPGGQMMIPGHPGTESNILPLQGGHISSIAEDLSTEQIIELLQNAADAQNSQNAGELGETNFDENGEPIQPMPEEIQLQLQQVLQERMMQQQQQQFLQQQQNMVGLQGKAKQSRGGRGAGFPTGQSGKMNDRVQSYQNICNILTESVSKAKEQHAHLGMAGGKRGKSASNSPVRAVMPEFSTVHTDQRILKQKKQFASLLKQYHMDRKQQEYKRHLQQKRSEKMAVRDEKIKAIKQRKFEEEMLNQQRSQMFKRNAQQVRLCKKVYKLASDLEKNKLLEEKKQYKENEVKKQSQKKKMVDTIENYYKDKINMLKERIDTEKFERQVMQEAQKKALSQMKKELDEQKKQELQRYIMLLQQEDEKFDIQNMYLGRLEDEIVKLYRKS